jgi:glutathione peroxidase-family protein
LEKLYKKYKTKGFVVMGFPCNQFGNQEPGKETEIKKFATKKYGITFPLFGRDRPHHRSLAAPTV